jgi:hypothetical protein
MRTTLEIDDDVLLAAKEMAQRQRDTAGKIISKLARAGLAKSAKAHHTRTRSGFPQFPTQESDAIVTMDFVNRLRDEGP